MGQVKTQKVRSMLTLWDKATAQDREIEAFTFIYNSQTIPYRPYLYELARTTNIKRSPILFHIPLDERTFIYNGFTFEIRFMDNRYI